MGASIRAGANRWLIVWCHASQLLLLMALVLPVAAGGVDLVVDGVVVELAGTRSYDNVRVVNGGVLTHPAATSAQEFSLRLQVAGEVLVDATSSIDVSGRGYLPGFTAGNAPGGAEGRSGGSHGGHGFAVEGRSNDAYGDFRFPDRPGAGAGPDGGRQNGGAGGGALRISAATLTLNGTIRADGADGTAPYPNGGGGGAGGSVWIDVGLLRGAGSISADGGRGNIHCYFGCRRGGGGGGGRVALYYGSRSFDLARVSAAGGDNGDGDEGPGAAGTVFLKAAGGDGELRIASTLGEPGPSTPLSLPPDAPVRVRIAGSGVLVEAERDEPLAAKSITLADGAVLSHAPATAGEEYRLWVQVEEALTIEQGAAIDVSGRGYSPGRTSGGSPVGAATGSGGGGYGGLGGSSGNFTYGDALHPTDLGSGGGGGEPQGGAGGGAVRVSADTLRVDGAIRADGADGQDANGAKPAGSGGSVLINAGRLSGGGTISADGGVGGVVCYFGCRFGGSGGGGRIAVYARQANGLPRDRITASGGVRVFAGEPAYPGLDGTLAYPGEARFVWVAPRQSVLHGAERLRWEALGLDPDAVRAEVRVAGGATSLVLASGRRGLDVLDWDTRQVPDGVYDLTVEFRDSGGRALGEAVRRVLVNNAIERHGGRIAADETWPAGIVHVVTRPVSIASGATLTVAAGAIVKFAPRAGIQVEAGGTLRAPASAAAPVILTALADDAAGGDTNHDGAATLPRPGDWDGLLVEPGATSDLTQHVDVRHGRDFRKGTLAADDTWAAGVVHEVIGEVIVPEGVSLTVEPGASVQFDRLQSIVLKPGSRLAAVGTVSQPVVFTSIRDTSFGQSFAGEHGPGPPAAGDWQWIEVDRAEARFEHAVLRYGGGSLGGAWDQTGMVRTYGGANLKVIDSALHGAFFDGILTFGGRTEVRGTVLSGMDRAVAGNGGDVQVTNCTLDDNRVGILVHGSLVSMANTVVSNSHESGVQYDFGTLGSVRYSDVWSPLPGSVNYRNTADRTGGDGNISVDPRYAGAAKGNYRPAYRSPLIDAADGTLAPLQDAAGAPRYDDPRVPNTGIAAPGGKFADIGAFEFVEDAPSPLDLVVSAIAGPPAAVAGERVPIEWTVTNIGTGEVVGPWHDAVGIVRSRAASAEAVVAEEVEVGQGARLGPGQSLTVRAEVRVPGSVVGAHFWQVVANAGGEVFEGRNRANNTATSEMPVEIDLDELVVDGARLAGRFTAVAEPFWFKVVPRAGEDVLLDLDRVGSGGATEMYVAQGYMPTRERFDLRQEPARAPDVSVLVPQASAQIYYVFVHPASLPQLPLGFTIGARTLALSIDSVGPARIGNTGAVTLTVRGGQLAADSAYELIDARGGVHAARSVFSVDSSVAYVTFDAFGLPLGGATVRVRRGGESVERPAALEVIESAPGTVEASLTVPTALRPDWVGTVVLDYRNTGGSDVVAPLMVVSATNARLRLAGRPSFAGSTLQVLGIHGEGPAGVLPPGAGGSVTIEMQPTIGGGTITTELLRLTDPDRAVEWDSLSASLRPSFVPVSAWTPIFSNFRAGVGESVADLEAALADNATYLGRLGVYTHDVERLLAFELRQAALHEIVERHTLGAFGRGTPSFWEMTVRSETDGTLVIGAGAQRRTFVLAGEGRYRGVEGDAAIVLADAGGYRLQEPDGSVLAFRPDGRFDSTSAPSGERVSAVYAGTRVAEIVDAAGNRISFEYDGNGRIRAATDPDGSVTTYDYDASGEHLIRITGPLGSVSMEYVTAPGPARHALSAVIYPDGTREAFDYDERGRLASETSTGGGERVDYAYDSAGGATLTSSAGPSHELWFDDAGRLGRVTDAVGGSARMDFGPFGPLRLRASGGIAMSFEYDGVGNLTGVVDPLGERVSLAYEETFQQLATITNARGAEMRYEYDDAGRMTGVVYPDGALETFAYDAAGNIGAWTNARGGRVRFVHDGRGRPTRKEQPGGAVQQITYDAAGNLTTVTGPAGTTRYEYDGRGRLTRMVTASGRTLEIGYDGAGRRVSLRDGEGFTLRYAYDAAGRLAAVEDGGGTAIVSYSYDAAGRLARKDFDNGTHTTYAYDGAGEIRSVVHGRGTGELSRWEYAYDQGGRQSKVKTPDGEWSYAYDAKGRLIRASLAASGGSVTAQDLQYEYDAAGNRTRVVRNGLEEAYETDLADRIVAAGKAVLTHDADGNRTGRSEGISQWTYAYDVENRLTGISGPDGTRGFEYDAFGNRVAAIRDGRRVEILVDPVLGDVIAEYEEGGGAIAHYVHGLGLSARFDASGAPAYYHVDALGSTTEVSDAAGQVVNRYRYRPFGEPLLQVEAVENPFRWLGELGAASEGPLVLLGARFFDPATGRFVQRDPAGVNGGVHLYAYAENDPINRVDPSGLGLISELAEIALEAPLEAKEIVELTKILRQPHLGTGGGGLYVDQFLESISRMSPQEVAKRMRLNRLSIRDVRLAKLRRELLSQAAKRPFLRHWVGKAGNLWRTGTTWLGRAGKVARGHLGRAARWARPYAGKALHVLGRAVVILSVAQAVWDSAAWAAEKAGWQDVADAMGAVWTSEGWRTAWERRFWNTQVVSSHDPNDIVGPAGHGYARWVGPEETLAYMVRFENDREATAPAQIVRVTEQLDAGLDLSTFRLTGFGLGEIGVLIPAGRSYHHERLDLRSTLGLFVDFTAELDYETGVVTWELVSIDPATGRPPLDPLSGFLPPNIRSPIGQGYVTYTVRAAPGAAIGTPIRATATIVFDTNEPIDTPEHVNPIGPLPDCVGDCNGDGTVRIEELIRGVLIGLGQPTSLCPAADRNADGRCTIDELIAAVRSSLYGCPGSPAPPETPLPSATRTPSRTMTVGPSATSTGSPTFTSTGTPDHTRTPSRTVTRTATSSPSATRSSTTTPTATRSASATPTVTRTAVAPPTPTPTPTRISQSRLYCDGLLAPLPIPDGDPFDGVHDSISVPAGPIPSRVRVHVRIDHSWVGDLVALVTHSSSQAVLLDHPGSGLCGEAGVDCVFDDAAAVAAADQCSATPPAIGGAVRGAESLDALAGVDAAGVWSLWVWDDFPLETGALLSWCVELD